MADKDFSTTLAYTKSPKASRRTTFQDELEAAVSARASKKKTDQYSYSDDFDEDDVLKELLNSRKKRIDTFKAGKKKAKINDFNLSDDEEESERPTRVSFMKTRKSTSPLQDLATPDPLKNEQTDGFIGGSSDQKDSDSLPSLHFKNPHQDYTESSASQNSQLKSPLSLLSQPSQTESPLQSTSENNSHWDSPLPLPSNGGLLETPLPLPSENCVKSKESGTGGKGKLATPLPLNRCASLTDSVVENEPPRPKPRQRILRVSSQTEAEPVAVDKETPPSRPPTSSVSISLSSIDQGEMASTPTPSSSSKTSARSHSRQGPVGDHSISSILRKSSSSTVGRQSNSLYKSTDGTWSGDGHTSEDSKAKDGKYSTSFEEYQDDSEDHPDHISRLSHVTENSIDTRPSSSLTKSSRKSQSVCSYTAESKYLGSLKILDRKVQLKEADPGSADSLRAAIYQEWLKKKGEKLQETMQTKKEEQTLKEEKRRKDEQAKIDDAKASYEAWKEKKTEVIKAKVKEKQDVIKKKQREIYEQEEKKESAKKVFEKWKQGHDELLKEKYRKQKEIENKQKQKKEETEEERKRDSISAISNWNERKKDVVHEKVKTERRKEKIKEEEERYEKEEKDRMALEMYEKWLRRKERQQTRQRKERQIQAILQDDPPPPWSPPSKTVPFGK
ncbi:microtubule-associated protein 9 [Salvelinus fontinalis]|uniref:microtubule-associated protein 9 n=1 Tax=Salvelinus fontinalis TaxID=8038 RepID=UPI0024858E74|nr:microtubule-associated protein 9 [Salvelinus fontinalis]